MGSFHELVFVQTMTMFNIAFQQGNIELASLVLKSYVKNYLGGDVSNIPNEPRRIIEHCIPLMYSRLSEIVSSYKETGIKRKNVINIDTL